MLAACDQSANDKHGKIYFHKPLKNMDENRIWFLNKNSGPTSNYIQPIPASCYICWQPCPAIVKKGRTYLGQCKHRETVNHTLAHFTSCEGQIYYNCNFPNFLLAKVEVKVYFYGLMVLVQLFVPFFYCSKLKTVNSCTLTIIRFQ